MFGIGPAEFFVIIVVAVLVLGPEHLPKVVRTFNKAMSEFRKVSTDFQRAMNLEATQEELRKAASSKPKKTASKTTQSKKTTTASAEGKPTKAAQPEQATNQNTAENAKDSVEPTEG